MRFILKKKLPRIYEIRLISSSVFIHCSRWKKHEFDNLPQPVQKSQLCFLLKNSNKNKLKIMVSCIETARWTSTQFPMPGLWILDHFLFLLLVSFKAWKETAFLTLTSCMRGSDDLNCNSSYWLEVGAGPLS